MPFRLRNASLVLIISAIGIISGALVSFAQEDPSTVSLDLSSLKNKDSVAARTPLTINADIVEYSTENNFATASGNVEINYKGSKLTCSKITVNTLTKEGVAEGGVRLEDDQGIIEAEKMTYNFNTKAGVMADALFRANPYFGKAEEIQKVNDVEFTARSAAISTCNYDHPHYLIKTRKVNFHLGEKLLAKENIVYAGQKSKIPLLYLPEFSKSFKKPFMHVQVSPGHEKYWGYYLLTAWRYNITDNISGNLLLDYRNNFGVAEGFTTNYTSNDFGKGDFKLYYTQERDKSEDLSSDVNVPKVFERYLIRWRHKWDIDKNTNVITEYYKITDSKRMIHGTQFNFLKDYFYREYERDELPLTYMQMHHLFSNSSLDVVVQPRVNRYYTQLEKMPEIKYTLPSSQIGNSRVYFENSSSFAALAQRDGIPATATSDVNETRFDTFNKVSFPLKLSVFKLTPFVANETTYYNADINDKTIAPRTIFSSGTDLSTKFYKIFDVRTGFLGLDINGLRHIITPTVTYNFRNSPTIPASNLRQIDSIDAITAASNSLTFQLQNKLQTKRAGNTVDLLDFRINNSYTFKSSSNRDGGTLSDFLLYLDVIPYSWMNFRSDATFSRDNHKFSIINADINFGFGPERSLGIGERYIRGGSKETVLSFNWRLNPKWKFSLYERYQFGNQDNLSRGLREQQYSLVRDMHCWVTEMTLNIDKDRGQSLWVIFRLKAFPELQFSFDQTYHKPTPGSQTSQ